MTPHMKTQTDIVIETLQFYLEAPSRRSTYGGGGCYYAFPQDPSRRCAVGLCMTEEAIEDHGDYMGDASIMADEFGSLDQFLKAEYHGHPTEFWQRLQNLHDEDLHWSDDASERRVFIAETFPDAVTKATELGLI